MPLFGRKKTAPPSLGIRFDVGKVGFANYGLECWKTFWRIVPPESLAGATLYEGDTDGMPRGGERVFCVGLGHPGSEVLDGIQGILDESDEYGFVRADPAYVEGDSLGRETLVESGRVDSHGQVAGEGLAVPALEAVHTEPKELKGLIAALQDPDESLRNHAALALGQLGDPTAVDVLLRTVGDGSTAFRTRIIYSLGKFRDSRAVDAVIGALEDPDWEVRLSAVINLGEHEGPQAVEPLIRALADTNASVRAMSAQYLGLLGDPRAIGPLSTALQAEEGFVRVAAEFGLERIGGPDAEKALIETPRARRRFEIAGAYSYARDRLRSHMTMPSGAPKTLELLDDVIRVIDEYASTTRITRVVGPWDYVELTQHLAEVWPLGLDRVRSAQRELRLIEPILAGLKKLVLVHDCGAQEEEVPDETMAILELDGPPEVDEVIRYLRGEFDLRGVGNDGSASGVAPWRQGSDQARRGER